MLENSEFSSYTNTLKTMVTGLNLKNFDSCENKLRILLLKDLLLKLELQYQESLHKTDDLHSNKIKEIFDYKNTIQLLIIQLEKDIFQ